MMQIVVSLLAGIIFGIGLVLAGMTNPAKVINFLDLFGTWDPSLAFVMGGAIAIALPAFALTGRMEAPVLGETFNLPSKTDIDPQLVGGAALFGAGWGLSGLCPGPAITALGSGKQEFFLFFLFMLVGMMLIKSLRSRTGMLAPQ